MAAPQVVRPRLVSGDRLSREEFHRRYESRPDVRRAELIDGEVNVASPTRYDDHDEPVARMVTLVGTYAITHPEVRAGNSPTIYLSDSTEVQPDALLWRPEPEGSGPRTTPDNYIEGAPQLVVEVAASSVRYDLGRKKDAYRRAGMLEYVVWRVPDHSIDWFRLENGEYVKVDPDAQGVIESSVFPGLRLDVPKTLAGDLSWIIDDLLELRGRRAQSD